MSNMSNKINISTKIIFLVFLVTAIFVGPTTKLAAQENQDLWRLVCAENEPKICQIRAVLTNDQGQTIARIVIGTTRGNNANLWYINTFLPLGLSIPKGVSYRIDDGDATNLTLRECDPQHCRASAALNNDILATMQSGNRLQLIFTDSKSDRTLGLNFSLNGFTRTFNGFVLNLLQ